ncbi:uncharacterized protein LY79DRAFT_144992 [Colletotrichum navitas]|uniref:Uncharacterized protein n=1 Tax=Colletotrichum navitas TaxID=681940 RepID=A0AAD8QC77_9PEZI|nr:uncharacterized protein LY79DRAFT_144992 [Colletotrichum navitas]KAK1599589.1 hypothetical protein LY79DRAFT_144992 [Colletotrichum navitas]
MPCFPCHAFPLHALSSTPRYFHSNRPIEFCSANARSVWFNVTPSHGEKGLHLLKFGSWPTNFFRSREGAGRLSVHISDTDSVSRLVPERRLEEKSSRLTQRSASLLFRPARPGDPDLHWHIGLAHESKCLVISLIFRLHFCGREGGLRPVMRRTDCQVRTATVSSLHGSRTHSLARLALPSPTHLGHGTQFVFLPK